MVGIYCLFSRVGGQNGPSSLAYAAAVAMVGTIILLFEPGRGTDEDLQGVIWFTAGTGFLLSIFAGLWMSTIALPLLILVAIVILVAIICFGAYLSDEISRWQWGVSAWMILAQAVLIPTAALLDWYRLPNLAVVLVGAGVVLVGTWGAKSWRYAN